MLTNNGLKIMQCVYVSLAKKYAKSIKELEGITGKTVIRWCFTESG